MTVPEAAATEIKSPFNGPRADLGKRARATDTVIIVTAIVAGLYFGRDVLVPIALAVLLSFVLAPVVIALARFTSVKSLPSWQQLLWRSRYSPALEPSSANSFHSSPRISLNTRVVIGKKLATLRSSDFGRGVVEKASDALQGLDAKIVKSPASPSTAPPAGQATQPPNADPFARGGA